MSPDVEAALVAYLSRELHSVELDVAVSTRVPGDRPGMFVRVQQTGGTTSEHVIVQAELAIQAWAPDDVTASNLARTAESLLLRMHGEHDSVWVRSVSSMGGIAYFPDPESRQPRYQFAVQVNVRATD